MKWKSEGLEDGDSGKTARPPGLNLGKIIKLCSQNRFLRIKLISAWDSESLEACYSIESKK